MVCWCSVIAVLAVLVAVVLCLLRIRTCRYFLKMTAWYLTILANATICCFVCTPLYFFGDTGKFIFSSCYYLSKWTGITCDVRNRQVLKAKAPYVVVMNHQSSLDVVVLANMWPEKCTVMMKESFRYVPFFGYAAVLANSIFVDRFNPEKAKQSLVKCAELMRVKKLNVVVFPEGTRNHEDGMLAFKKGAFNIAVQAGIPIIPCVVSSFRPFYNRDERIFLDSGRVIVEFLEPVPTENLEFGDVTELTEKVRSQMMETYKRISKEAAEDVNRNESVSKAD